MLRNFSLRALSLAATLALLTPLTTPNAQDDSESAPKPPSKTTAVAKKKAAKAMDSSASDASSSDSAKPAASEKSAKSSKSKSASNGASSEKTGSKKSATGDTGTSGSLTVKPAEGTVYVAKNNIDVRHNPKVKEEKFTSVSKPSALNVFEEATAGGEKWLHVKFNDGKNDITGWVRAQFTVASRDELMAEPYRKLDYAPQNKAKEYPNNPRVKVNGVYVSYSSAGIIADALEKNKPNSLISLCANTRINAFVIDVKEDAGMMTFKSQAAEKYAPKANDKPSVRDIAKFIKQLKEHKIYTIARIVTFKDPIYAKTHPDRVLFFKADRTPYMQRDKLLWASAYDRELWAYDIAVAKEAAQAGFNEIQFDYVRFPETDPVKKDPLIEFHNKNNETKPQAIQNFLKQAYAELSPLQVYVGADVFGLIPTSPTDERIGQYWEAITNVVDYICPMMYPGHYAEQTYRLPVPDAQPYECILACTRDAVNRNKNVKNPAIIRPWIQDFTSSWVRGHIKYGEKEVRSEIRALKENGVTEFMLWNAANKFTESALSRE